MKKAATGQRYERRGLVYTICVRDALPLRLAERIAEAHAQALKAQELRGKDAQGKGGQTERQGSATRRTDRP